VQDPNVVYDEKQQLEQAGILRSEEIERFATDLVKWGTKHEKLFAHTQAASDRFNDKYRELIAKLEALEKRLEQARQEGDTAAVSQLDAARSDAAKARDQLDRFRDGLAKFVSTYQFIAQIIDLDDPDLEAFAEFARLLRRRLDRVPIEQIDTSNLKLLQYALVKRGQRNGIDDAGEDRTEEPPLLHPRGAGGQGEPLDRQKELLSELIRRMNEVFTSDLADRDKIVFLIHLSESLRANHKVRAQVENNPREDALKGDLPSETMKAVTNAMASHRTLAMELLKQDHDQREQLYSLLYDLLANPGYGRQLLEGSHP
jgi:type I restriction enzyme R subunit